MASYGILFLYALGAEILRRICVALYQAYVGPLAKVPGPFWWKFSKIPWKFVMLKGVQIDVGPELIEKYGEIVRVSPDVLIVAGKDAIYKCIVEDDLKKGPAYDMINVVDGVNTLFTERDKVLYKQKRRMMSPGFSIAYLNGLESAMHSCNQVFEDCLRLECERNGGSATVNIFGMLGNLGSDMLSATVLGESLNLVSTNDSFIRNVLNHRLKMAALYSNMPFLKGLPFMPPPILEEWNVLINEIIAKRTAIPKEKRKRDLLELFLDQHEEDPANFTEEVLREEIQLFMVAGSDTTSYTSTCCLLLLLNNQARLDELVKEIDEAFPDINQPITFEKIQGLPYLNGVINEALRLMPAASSGLHRITTSDMTLNGYTIPRETVLQPWVSHTMVDERIWPDAQSFVPERWLGEYKGATIDRKAFLPFSGGSRNCIGQQYALRELRIILANLFRRFDLFLVPGQSHKRIAMVTPHFVSGQYLVTLRPRQK